MPTIKSILIAIYLFTTACSKQGEQTASEAETLTDVSYGADNRHKMDIYLPADRSTGTTNTIVLIHGGGWSGGDKQDFAPTIGELKNRFPGYAILNLNYRLYSGNNNRFPAQENDVKSAIDFVLSKTSEYKINGKMALIGASAGAHLALLQSYKHNGSTNIKAVVSLFGPTELVSLYNNPPHPDIKSLLASVIGGTPESASSLYQESSPYNYVTAQSPPTILFHGGIDPLVPASQSVLLRDKLQSSGVTQQYVFYPNEAHGWTGLNLLDTLNKIEAFLKQHLPS